MKRIALLFLVACNTAPDETQANAASEPANGDFALLFEDTSTERSSDGDWDACRGKVSCAPGETIRGLSEVPNGHGRRALCHPAPSNAFTGNITATLTLDAGVDQRRAARNGDWAYGQWKLECGAGEYVAAVSENASQCQGDRRFHAVRCAQGNNLGNSCSVRTLDNGDDRGTDFTGDWDFGAYKGECAANEYVAGVSVDPGSGRPHSLLCCGSQAAPACSKIGVQSQDANPAFSKFLDACPRVAKWIYPDFAAMRDFKAKCPASKTVLRIFGDKLDRPTADQFWDTRYKPVLQNATAADKAALDFLESDNECDAGWCTFSEDDAVGYGNFLRGFVARAKAEGWKPLIFNIGVGNPDGEVHYCGGNGIKKFGSIVQAIKDAGAAGGGWSYHAYTDGWSKDANAQIWTALRYRLYTDCFPEIKNVPLVITEAGHDRHGNAATDGWAANGDAATYMDWLGWWNQELEKDSYVVGATLFTMSSDPKWNTFLLNPIVNDLINRIHDCE
jgi:hypothetical protein